MKKTEEMLHQIMLAINNIIYEQVTSHTCQKLEPKVSEYLQWLTENSDINSENFAEQNRISKYSEMEFDKQDTYLFGAPLSGTKV